MLRELGRNTPLFNVDYETATNQSAERQIARLAAKRLGFKLVEIDFEPARLFLDLATAYAPYDEPCNQLPLVYFHTLCKRIKDHGVTVLLSGNGADEVFFGYNGQHTFRHFNFLSSVLPFMLPKCFIPQKYSSIRRLGWKNFVIGELRNQLTQSAGFLKLHTTEFNIAIEEFSTTISHEIEASGFSEYQDYYAWHELLISGAVNGNYIMPDIGGLQAQVEVRCPFLDKNFLTAAGKLHIRNKIGSSSSDKYNKAVLKRLYADRVGSDVAYADKRGFGWNIRFGTWIKHDPVLAPLFRHMLTRLGDFGLDPSFFLTNFERYRDDTGGSGGAGGVETVTGFCLAAWFIKEFEGNDALAQTMEQVRNFQPAN